MNGIGQIHLADQGVESVKEKRDSGYVWHVNINANDGRWFQKATGTLWCSILSANQNTPLRWYRGPGPHHIQSRGMENLSGVFIINGASANNRCGIHHQQRMSA
jgi:hypothetical protein